MATVIPKTLVLLSTFNGEKYLEEQLLSIIMQEGADVDVLIRDDGSADGTVDILERFRLEHDNVRYFVGSNVGVKRSFLELICAAEDEYDYYSLADQDDIWLLDKVSVATAALARFGDEFPCLYGSSVVLYDGVEPGAIAFRNPDLRFGNFLFKNYYPGCTMVFNKSLKQLICKVQPSILANRPLHDHWINLVCLGCGGRLVFDNVPRMLYRQHDGNVVGNRSFLAKVRGNGLIGKSDNTRLAIAAELASEYVYYLDSDALNCLATVIAYTDSTRNRIKLAFDSNIKPVRKLEIIVASLMVLLGKF